MSGKKRKRVKLPAWIAGLAAAAVWSAIGLAGAAVLKSGGQDIGAFEMAAPKVTLSPAPEIDIALVKSSLAKADISGLGANDTLLASGTDDAPSAELQPVYNGVFSRDGLQIASLADSRLKCRTEVIVPMSQMLDAFYSETGLRTLMINAAFEPYTPPAEPAPEEGGEVSAAQKPAVKCAEHSNGYSFDFGVYIQEEDSRREFTLEGQYSWFSKHSWEYGFIQRYPHGREAVTGIPGNDSHFRYVGKLAAKIMNENGLCFEQLADFMSQHTADDPLVVDGSTVVYLYKLEDSSNKAPVPVSQSGEPVNCEIYYLGKDEKAVLVAAKPTPEFYAVPKEKPAAEQPAGSTEAAESKEG